MPTKYFVEYSRPINSFSADLYKTYEGNRIWTNHPRPYSAYVGAFEQWRTTKKSGLYQSTGSHPDSYGWSVNLIGAQIGSLRYSLASRLWTVASRNAAVFQLQSKLNQSDFNLGITGAEAAKTADTIGNAVKRIAKAALAVKRGNIAAAAKHLGVKGHNSSHSTNRNVRNNAASHWLELQYGWKPLLNDVHNACKTLAELCNQPNADMFFARGRGRNKVSRSHTFEDVNVKQRIDMVFDFKHEFNVFYRIRSGNISTAAKLGLTNPLAIAWEVVPFSFVVDWFIPVGRLLGQLNAYHGLEFVIGSETSFYRGSYLADKGVTKTGGNLKRSDQYFVEDLRIDRLKLTGFPFAYPVIQDPFSVTRALSAVALIQSVLGGFGKR